MFLNRVTVNKSEEKPTNILTNEAKEGSKKAATLKNDYVTLGAIKDVDLIAAECKKHRKCHRQYTRTLSETNNKEGIKESEPVYEKGDFKSVCKTVENEIINQGKWMPIDTLLNIYRENVNEEKSTDII